MEPVAPIVDKLKSFVKSGEDFVSGLTRRWENKARRNPIEILKRLQREAFSDLMKLRERQDKVERIISFYSSSKGGPFQGGSTRVKGKVDVMGSLFLMDYLDQQHVDAIKRAGIRTGIDARICFQTKVHEHDILEAEFISSHVNHCDSIDVLGTTLALSKVCYKSDITDWFSVVAIPMGARCRDMAISSNSSCQEKGLTDCSSFGPPFLHQNHGGAIGLQVKKYNIIGSLAQCVLELPSSLGHCLSTFGQIVCELPKSTKLSFFGLHQVHTSRQQPSFGPLAMPLGILRRRKTQSLMETTIPSTSLETSFEEDQPAGSVAVMLESELDESTGVRGWVQVKTSNPRHLQWAIGMSDFPEDEIGWGLSLGGTMRGPNGWDHFQVEAFLKFNLGKRLSVQPAFLYLIDGSNQMPALMLRSSWSL